MMYRQENVKRVQQRLLEMAKQIAGILEKHDIPYFITYGTLLGAVRHGGFIPWDDDFDFYLFGETYEQAISCLRQELSPDLFLEDGNSEPLYFHGWAHVKDLRTRTECELFPIDGHYAHKGLSVDLYRTCKIPEKEEKVYRLTEHRDYLQRRLRVGLIDEESYAQRMEMIETQLSKELKVLKEDNSKGREIYAFSIIYDDRLYLDELFPLKYYAFEDTQFLGPNNADALLRRCYGDYMKLPPIEKRHPHYSSVEFLD